MELRQKVIIALWSGFVGHLFFSLIVAGGGVWSVNKCNDDVCKKIIGSKIEWALGGLSFTSVPITFNFDTSNPTTINVALTMSYDDFSDVADVKFPNGPGVGDMKKNAKMGGEVVSAFLVISVFLGAVTLFLILAFNNDKRELAKYTRWTLVWLVLYVGLSVVPWTAWEAAGHNKGATKMDGLAGSKSELGWCFYVYAALAWPCALVMQGCTAYIWFTGPDFSLPSSSSRPGVPGGQAQSTSV